jgi:putative endonuclease
MRRRPSLFMVYVYLIRSVNNYHQTYIGYTTNVQERLEKHNSGGSIHTKEHRPWKLVASVQFDDQQKALEFEKYLKSGSGRAFAARRFW